MQSKLLTLTLVGLLTVIAVSDAVIAYMTVSKSLSDEALLASMGADDAQPVVLPVGLKHHR